MVSGMQMGSGEPESSGNVKRTGDRQYFAAVCGLKNSGKTTLLEALVRTLTARGLRTAVIKHDGHDFACDLPGTDSFRYVEAGASGAAVFSKNQLFVRKICADLEASSSTLKLLAAGFPEADVLLVEGCKDLPVRKIEVVRGEISCMPVSNPEGRFLIVSDLPAEQFEEEVLPFEAVDRIADAICAEDPGSAARTGSGVPSAEVSEGPKKNTAMCDIMETNRAESTARDMEQDFTHFDTDGRARMVDVGEKGITHRTAVAAGRVLVSPGTFRLIKTGGLKKGDVLGTAQVAGIMGAKRTPDLIPMCHPLFLSGIRLQLMLNEEDCSVDIRAEVSCEGRTGVEMEALTAVSTAALTVYDMCKAVQRDIRITDIRLVRKTGGIHGDYLEEE